MTIASGVRCLFLAAWSVFLGITLPGAQTVVDLSTDSDAVEIIGEEVRDRAGIRATSCDINGDGLADLVVGADLADGPDNLRGACGEVYVVLGRRFAWKGPLSFEDDVDLRIIGQNSTDELGRVACGDIDNDGFDDIVMGAPYADRFRSGQWFSGEVQVVFGSPALPPVIDLLTDPQLVIHGETESGSLAYSPQVGDVNGDGTPDLILDDYNAFAATGAERAGRVYVLFGRNSWPADLDLRIDAGVKILNAPGDRFGANLLVGDLNHDGIDEIVIAAQYGDGPADSRTDAGDVHVLLGKTTWPATIDLGSEAADSFLFGADAGDQAGTVRGLGIGDLDRDGSIELVVGSFLAGGITNEDALTGETKTIEFGASPPAQSDLGLDFESVIWGADEGDYFSAYLGLADVNGDDTTDFIGSASNGDGPSEARTDAGEIALLYGGTGFPASFDLATSTPNLLVIGREPNDRLGLRAWPDLNGDGFFEIVAQSNADSFTDLPSIWIVSPFDFDGDGVTQLPDNCPLVANPSQSDADMDGRGDACATDWDGDGQEDDQDCAPNDPAQGTPASVENVTLTGVTITSISWSAASFSDLYDVERGLITQLNGSDFGECQNARDPDRTDTLFVDDEPAPPGQGFFYLVRGVNLSCGQAGGYGDQSSGDERTNSNPSGCP